MLTIKSGVHKIFNFLLYFKGCILFLNRRQLIRLFLVPQLMRIFLLSVFSLFFTVHSIGQNNTLSGTIEDTATNKNMAHTVVALLKQSDSTLVTFTHAGSSGKFNLSNLSPGKFLILITNPLFGDYIDQVEVTGNLNLDLGRIPLTGKATLLKEIIIRAQAAAIKLKGDTTEYTADSFKVKPNATVEDLIKKMPGIQVDKNGQVTAMGQKVEKVLVDGEEFFSDDPTVATRNIRADAVDKVQVFDKKSDQAAFTGIDDGVKTKTLNLKLKDDKKKGYFGKLSVGALDKYHTGEAMINAFKTKRKLAAFILTSNTDKTGLNWVDEKNYGAGNGDLMNMTDDGSVMISRNGSNDDFGGQNYFGQGLPESYKAGLHFSDKWKHDIYNVNSNYRFNKLNETSRGSTYRKNILVDSVYYDNESGNSSSQKNKNSLSGTLEIQLDSSSSIKLSTNGSIGTSTSHNFFKSQALSQENLVVNSSDRSISQTGDNSTLNTSAIWRKKFKKKGRTISITADERYRAGNSSGYLYNLSSYYKGLVNFKTDTTDQKKINENISLVLSTRMSYTEPLSKKATLELNYSITHNSSNSTRITFNNDNGKYSKYLDSLSNQFRYNITTNSGGINYRYNSKKYNYSLGTNIANTAFRQTDLVIDTTSRYNYINIYPRAGVGYRFTQYSALNLNYNGSSRQPTIEQIQPVRENSNPLNIMIGNPNLKQEFRHNISLSYNDFKILNQRSIYISVNYLKVDRAISNSFNVDTLGKRTNKAVNVDGDYGLSSYLYYSMKIPKTNLRLSGHPNFNISRNTNYVNNQKNTTISGTYSFGIDISASKEDKYEVRVSPAISYNTNRSSISSGHNTSFWSFEQGLDASYTLPFKLEIGSEVSYNYRQKISAFDKNNTVLVWNAYLQKKFLKKEALVLRFTVNDILNQNQGYSQSITSTSVEERHYTTFMRYGLLTLSWNFSNNGSPSKSPF